MKWLFQFPILWTVTLSVFFFLFGFSAAYFRHFPYSSIRVFVDQLRSVTDQLPKPTSVKPSVLILGDSQARRGVWNFLYDQYAPINLGIGGLQIEGLIHLIEKTESLKSGQAIVLIGINDLGENYPVHDAISAYRKLLELFQERDITPVLITVPEMRGTRNFDRRPAIRLFNSEILKLAREFSFQTVDANQIWSDENGVQYGVATDSLHLTVDAYKMISAEVLDALERQSKKL